MEDNYGHIEFSSNASMVREEPMDYVNQFSGTIFGFPPGAVEEEEVGTINGFVIDVKRVISDGRTLSDVTDASMETDEYLSYLWNPETEEFKETITEESVDTVVVIEKILISPTYSGNNFALSAIQTTVSYWTSSSEWLVLLKASPLQHCLKTPNDIIEKFDLNRFNKEEKESTDKLITHYGKIGFECIDDTNFMYVNGALKSKFNT
jgi:hypothetical protein